MASISVAQVINFPLQDDRVLYRDVVEVQSAPAKQIIDHFQSILSLRTTTHRTLDQSGTILNTAIGTAGMDSDTQSIINEFNISNEVKIQDNTLRTNVLQVFISKYLTQPQLIFVRSKIRIDVKDGRYRYTISDFFYEHRLKENPYGGGSIPIATKGAFNSTPRENCEASGTLYTLTLCDKPKKNLLESLEMISEDLDDLVSLIRSDVTAPEAEDDDW